MTERDRARVFAKMWCLNIGAKIYEIGSLDNNDTIEQYHNIGLCYLGQISWGVAV